MKKSPKKQPENAVQPQAPVHLYSYQELLKHPFWQRKRLEIMQRDDFRCVCCGDNLTTLHVHHKEYEDGKMPWEYPDDVLVTLCEDCHMLIESIKKHTDEDWSDTKMLKLKHQEKNELIYFALRSSKSRHGEMFLGVNCYINNELMYSCGLPESLWVKIKNYLLQQE